MAEPAAKRAQLAAAGSAAEPAKSMAKTVALKVVTLSTIITFLWGGLTINLLQVAIYLTLRPLNFQLFARLNYYLMYSAFAPIVALYDWFVDTRLTVYHAKREQEDDIFDEHSIFLANHGYELDWLGAWLSTDKFGHLANCKAMLKSDLKYIPVAGWAWALSDQLFLDRNWEADKHKFAGSMDTLLRYRPMVATFFCEGTRFTKDKLEASHRFAAERGIQAPKYHLIPRTKGFVAVVQHLKMRRRENPQLKVWVYDAQVGYDERGAMNISDVLERGLSPRGHLYFERYSLDDIPDEEQACAQWLHDLFLRKDKLQEYFNNNCSFPGHIDRRFVNYKPRWSSLFNWCLWTSYTAICLAWLVTGLHARYGVFWVSVVMAGFLLLSYVYLTYVIYQADVGEEENAHKKAK